MKLELLGMEINIWGLYCAIGALCAFAAIWVVCASQDMKKASAPVLGLTSIVLGIVCSRLLYCLFTTVVQVRIPFSAWISVTDGGWSMTGMMIGVMLAGWISAKITGEKAYKMLDAVSIALPLMIAAERIGERSLQGFFEEAGEKFNLSREVAGSGFMTVVNQDKTYLATYMIAAVLAMVLFLILVFSLLDKKRRDGDLWIRFMMLCGAFGVIAESLRYDDYLVYSFVRIQQVLYALMLFAGVILCGRKIAASEKRIYRAAMIAMIPMIIECVGLEFSLDRSDANKVILHLVMAGAVTIPVIQGFVLLRRKKADDEDGVPEGTGSMKAVFLVSVVISVAEVAVMAAEITRIHSWKDPFLLLSIIPAVFVMLIHSLMMIIYKSKER